MESTNLGISVVITTYNDGDYLRDLLDSLVVQEQPLEIVIVDSLSTDNTSTILKQYAAKYPFIRYIRRKCSRGEGRNIGVSESKYDYILFTDGDAIANAFWVRKMRKQFARGYRVVAGKTIQMGYGPFEKLARVELFFENYDVTYPSVNLGYLKTLFLDLGGFDPDFITAEDIDLNIRAVLRGAKIGYCDECVIYHRTRSTVIGFIQQAFWNGFGRKQLTRKHQHVWSHFKPSALFDPKVINFWYIIRGVSAIVGYVTCRLFGLDFIRHYHKTSETVIVSGKINDGT
ncbi:MAG: glycosyltransferase [Thermoplasmata archaeon]